MKEKMCLCGVHMTTCPIFVWVSTGVLPLKDIYVSLLKGFMEQSHCVARHFLIIVNTSQQRERKKKKLYSKDLIDLSDNHIVLHAIFS